jgi:translation initiation factor 2-alpha kinase 4
MFEYCDIALEHRGSLCTLLSQLGTGGKNTWKQIRAQALRQIALPAKCLDALSTFLQIHGPFEQVKAQVHPLLERYPYAADAWKELLDLKQQLSVFDVQCEVYVELALLYNYQYYKNGIMFQLALQSKRADILAGGGCYGTLLRHFQHPSAHNAPLHAVGISIACGKLSAFLEAEQAEVVASGGRVGRRQPAVLSRCDVYVASFGGDQLLSTRISICAELWTHGIRADFMARDDQPVTQEELQAYCRQRSIPLLVLAKSQHRGRDVATLKLRNVRTKHETEIARKDLVEFVLREMHGEGRTGRQSLAGDSWTAGSTGGASQRARSADLFYHPQQHSSHISGESHRSHALSLHDSSTSLARPPLNVTVLQTARMSGGGKGGKQFRKQAVVDRALKAIHAFTEQLHGGVSTATLATGSSGSISGTAGHVAAGASGMEVLVVEAPMELLRRLAAMRVLFSDDDAYKRDILDTYPRYRDQAQLLKQRMLDWRKARGHGLHFGILYSSTDDDWVVVRV